MDELSGGVGATEERSEGQVPGTPASKRLECRKAPAREIRKEKLQGRKIKWRKRFKEDGV